MPLKKNKTEIIKDKLDNNQINSNSDSTDSDSTDSDSSDSDTEELELEKKINKKENEIKIEVENCDGNEYLEKIKDNTIDLILTDPPYIISHKTGMDIHYNTVKNNEKNNVKFVKTEEEWEIYKKDNKIKDDTNKDNYLKYGTKYGKKYCVKTDYGDWDKDFTEEVLEKYIATYYKKLRKGGTLIIFFDLWKITNLKDLLEKYKFKQIRFIEWIKTNPQPINSKVNYLTNCREIALLGIKDGNPTFNSKYDKGIYSYPLQGGKDRFHPTQKSLLLFEDLIKKHSNENDIILDTFLGSGTTALACKNTNRNFKGCEISKEYYDKFKEILNRNNEIKEKIKDEIDIKEIKQDKQDKQDNKPKKKKK